MTLQGSLPVLPQAGARKIGDVPFLFPLDQIFIFAAEHKTRQKSSRSLHSLRRRLPLLLIAGQLEVAGGGRPISGNGAAPPPKKSNQKREAERTGVSKPHNRNGIIGAGLQRSQDAGAVTIC